MSPQQKRSTQYDWFKGSQANGGKKTPKEHAKLIWKFTKILIYLALFVFSITGCIQTLVIKTQTTVGKGVEFYSSKDEVAPHVTKINFGHETGTQTTKDIYTLETSDANYWLNKDVKAANGTSALANVHAAIKGQRLDSNGNGNLQLTDAFKGSNEGLIIETKGAKDTGLTADSNGNLLVLSSKAETSAFAKFADASKNTLEGINIFSKDNDVYSKTKLKANTLVSFDGEYSSRLAQAFDGAVDDNKQAVKLSAGAVYDNFHTVYLKARDLINNTIWTDKEKAKYNKKIVDIKDDYVAYQAKPINNVNITRQAYSLAALNTLLNVDGGNALAWLKTDITLPTGKTLQQVMVDTKSTDPIVVEAIRQVNARADFFQNAIATVGLIHNSFDVEDGFHFKAGYYPYNPGSTDWRPLVTWADAWGEGPFYGIFAYPVAYISANMINSMPVMSGWEALISIFVIVFAIRILTFLLSFKATMQQTKMQELQSKKAVIDAKYAAYKGNKQMENRQKQEVSEMYKKEGVSMFGSISTIFLTMPFFLAIWRTIGGLPHIKSAVWLGINFSATSWRELFAGQFQYLPLMILAAAFAAFQQILPRLLTRRRDKNRINVHQKAAMKKSNKTQNIMMIVFVFMALIFSAGLQVYWIAGGLWMTIQSTITHHLIIRQSKKAKRGKVKV